MVMRPPMLIKSRISINAPTDRSFKSAKPHSPPAGEVA